MRSILAFVFFCNLLSAQPGIDQVLETWKSDKSLVGSTLAYCVMEAPTGSVVAEYNSHTFVVPASTLKVITTSAALGVLGKNFRYDTKIYFTGTFNKESGVLDGDIIIKGSGDPTLNSELFRAKNDTTNVTDKWAETLKQKGLKEVKGKIIGDASCFERHIPANWIWGDISNYFGVAPCGLTFNDNLYSLVFTSAEKGSKVKLVDLKPRYTSLMLEHDVDVTAAGQEDDAYVYGDPFGNKKSIRGTIPPNKTNMEVRAALPDPALLCAEFLQVSLMRAGIKCSTLPCKSVYEADDADVKKEKTIMLTHFSPGLEKIVYYTNLTSNNLFSETLLKSMGKGSNYLGIDKAKTYWKEKGLETTELYMVDGNGLSRADNVTTYFEASLLQKMYTDSLHYKTFNNSLPVAGLSGSMSHIGKGTFLEKNMRAKTGYISRARGYCGYVKSKSGKELCFSVLFNNYNCSAKEAKAKIEQMLIAIGNL